MKENVLYYNTNLPINSTKDLFINKIPPLKMFVLLPLLSIIKIRYIIINSIHKSLPTIISNIKVIVLLFNATKRFLVIFNLFPVELLRQIF